jgi:hypothetical protein
LLLALLLNNSSVVSASELQKFNVPLWTDKLSDNTADSKLHLQTTGAEGLVRWTGTPLKINGTNSKGLPDGAYITGDVVNGKRTTIISCLPASAASVVAICCYSEQWITS